MVKRASVKKNVTKKCTVKKKELKLSHKLFVAEYIANGGNAVKAYIDTYPDTSYTAALDSSAQLLVNPCIKEEIDKRLYSHSRKVDLTSEHAKQVLKEIIELDPIDYVNPDTAVPLPPKDIPKHARKYIARWEIESAYDDKGNETGKKYKYWFKNEKLQATDQLHKLLGLYAEVQSIHEVQVRAICDLIWAAIRELAPELIPKIVAKFKELHSQVDPELLDAEGKNPVIVINRG